MVDKSKRRTAPRSAKKRPEFKRNLISLCVMAATSGVAVAQQESQADPAEGLEIEEILVLGNKLNLTRAQDIKRNADTFVDAISASDINSLPDKSVLEAVQRLPGVSIERFAAANDADHFSVEGSGVVVRGLTQTRSEFNSRDAFAANNDNGLSFQDIPPELVGGVQLVKNQTADMIEGGISGTINLITRKPFDSDEDYLAFTLKSNYSDLIDEVTPSASGTYSKRWENNSGEWGFLINASATNLKSRADGIQIYNYFDRSDANGNPLNGTNGESVWVPQAANIRRQDFDRDRAGGAASLQWRSPDQDTEVTVEYIYSDSTINWAERAIEDPDQPISPRNVQPLNGTNFVFANNGNGQQFFQSGIISSPSGSGGERYLTYSRDNIENSTIHDFSVNVKHNVNDRFRISGDLQFTDAVFDQLDISAMGNFFSDMALNVSGSLPTLEHRGNDGDLSPLTDPALIYFRSAMDHAEDDEGDELAARLDFDFDVDKGWVQGVKAGVRLAERENTIRESRYNWGAVSESWAGGVQTFEQVQSVDPGLTELYSFDDFFGGRGLQGPNTFLFPAFSLVDVDNYADYHNRILPFNTANNWNSLGNRAGVVEGSLFLPTEISTSKLQNSSAYVRLDFGSDDYAKRFAGNIGLRYVNLDWDLTGGVTFPNSPPSNLDQFFSADDIAFSTGGLVGESTTTDSYSKLLPSFNLKVELSDDLIARFAYSKAISLPDLRDKRNSLTISRNVNVIRDANNVATGAQIQNYSGSGGNPELDPIESDNIDLSLEWYFADAGSLTASLFHKDVTGFFRFGPTAIRATNNGVTRDILLNGPVNGEDAKVKGFELAYTQFYDFLPEPWDGFGLQANYTYIDSNGSSESSDALTPEGNQVSNAFGIFDGLPLEGLSEDTFNLIAMYEKGKVSARIAYNYRSKYLLTTRDVITFSPNVSEATEQVDASFHYHITDNLKIGIEANNLTNEVSRLLQVVDENLTEAPRSFFVNDRRYTLTLSGSF